MLLGPQHRAISPTYVARYSSMALSQLLFLRPVLIMTGPDSNAAFVPPSALDLEADLSNAEILKPQWNSMCKTFFLCVQTKN